MSEPMTAATGIVGFGVTGLVLGIILGLVLAILRELRRRD